jgi:hypothetical protein
MTCYEAAREYLALGLHPIPCAPRSKRPLVEWRKFQVTPPHADQVDAWWETWPDANVALVLGRGALAVDLDGGADASGCCPTPVSIYPAPPGARRQVAITSFCLPLDQSRTALGC